MKNKNIKVLIVGLGLIGGSYALALKDKGYEVGAITLNQEDIDYAISNNIIDHGFVEVKKDYVSSFDLVICALYPHVFIDWISKYASYFKKGAIITDATGVKKEVVYQIEELLKDQEVEFIGAHPMAGREVSGVRNAKKDLFKNANYIITPTTRSSQDVIDASIKLAKELNFKNVSVLSVEKHDEMIAFLSQLTHVIAISLMTCKDSLHLKDYTGDSFRDLTRIAKINEEMWTELFLLNKEELLSQMDLFMNQFNSIKLALENNDEQTLKEIMKLSTFRRSFFDKD